MALENLTALVLAASADADRIIAKASSDEAALAQAQSDIASMEAQAVSVVQPLADKLSARPLLRSNAVRADRDCAGLHVAGGQTR